MTQLRLSWIAVGVSFLGAAVLELLAMPQFMNQFRPEWVVLTLVYWLIRHPEKVGVFFAFFVGLILDVISGSYLGVQAVSCCIVSYLVLTMHQRLKMFPIIQQSMVVFFILGIQLMIVSALRSNIGTVDYSMAYLWSAASSALVWPFVLILTDRINFILR